jgi:colanic acid/amylovoran biosynthesis protein
MMWALGQRMGEFDLPVGRRLRVLLRAYADADVVIAAGGCYLYTTSAIRGNVILLINLYSFFLGVLLGKPVYLYAQSIGPFASSIQAWLVRSALCKVRMVEFREEISGRLLEDWRLPTPTRAAADGAFLVPARAPSNDLDIRGNHSQNTVGMTVRKWYRDPRAQESYERTMAAFLDWLADERKATTVLLPQVTFVEGNDDDRVTARAIVGLMSRQDRARVLTDELSAEEIKWLCGQTDFFVGTRMHSNIFALSLGVPTLAISYQHKTEGIMASLGLDDFVVPISAISLDVLKEQFDALVRRRHEVCVRLSEVIPEIELQAELAGRYIAEDFSCARDRGGSRDRAASTAPHPPERS